MTFKYRYVGFGTRFNSAEGLRSLGDAAREPGLLHANEIAVDVGGGNWSGAASDPAVIDHHTYREDQFPSAAAGVLHHGEMIRRRFSGTDWPVVWLVTHREADFDSLAAMYLCRWLILDPKADCDWEQAGLDPQGWRDVVDPARPNSLIRRFDWFKPDLARFPEGVRWAVLLASYASHVDHARRIFCPRAQALHSVLYAGLVRGRDYRNEDGGALELFDEARRAFESGLNPLFDPIFGEGTKFGPELAMLERESKVYERDVSRARKAIVFVPALTGRFADAYDALKTKPLLDAAGEIDPAQLGFGGADRVPTDGLYLRDPECILFKEWARLDVDNSSLGEGFTFTAIAYSDERPGVRNQSDYFFALDAENARNRHLYPLWARLQQAEIRAWNDDANQTARRALESGEERAVAAGRTICRPEYTERAGRYCALFADPWYDGAGYRCTIVGTPNGGTLIGPPGVERDLRDDPVAQLVRSELESSIYISAFRLDDRLSINGPGLESVIEREVTAPDGLAEAVSPGYYRFGSVAVDDCADFGSDAFARETGRLLWRMLHPAQRDGPPSDPATGALVRGANILGVWSPVGAIVAYKPGAGQEVAELRAVFAELVALALTANELMSSDDPSPGAPAKNVPSGEGLSRQVAGVRQRLTRPGSQVLERFARGVRLFETLDAVRDPKRVQATPLPANRATTALGPHAIFVCHAHADYDTAMAACDKLEAAGVRCWIAPRDVGAGAYASQLVRAISSATAVLLMFTSKSNASEHVLRELEIAASRQKVIVPLRLEAVTPNEDLEYFTLRMHWLDALTPPLESRLDELTAFIVRLVATQAAAVPSDHREP
jgi:hypothetical protein